MMVYNEDINAMRCAIRAALDDFRTWRPDTDDYEFRKLLIIVTQDPEWNRVGDHSPAMYERVRSSLSTWWTRVLG
jgi:hypothetical protein